MGKKPTSNSGRPKAPAPDGRPQPGAPKAPPFRPDPALYADMEKSATPTNEQR